MSKPPLPKRRPGKADLPGSSPRYQEELPPTPEEKLMKAVVVSFERWKADEDPEITVIAQGGLSPDMVEAFAELVRTASPEDVQRVLANVRSRAHHFLHPDPARPTGTPRPRIFSALSSTAFGQRDSPPSRRGGRHRRDDDEDSVPEATPAASAEPAAAAGDLAVRFTADPEAEPPAAAAPVRTKPVWHDLAQNKFYGEADNTATAMFLLPPTGGPAVPQPDWPPHNSGTTPGQA